MLSFLTIGMSLILAKLHLLANDDPVFVLGQISSYEKCIRSHLLEQIKAASLHFLDAFFQRLWCTPRV